MKEKTATTVQPLKDGKVQKGGKNDPPTVPKQNIRPPAQKGKNK